MGVVFTHRGSFSKLEKFLKNYDTRKLVPILEQYGGLGVQALSRATPALSGITASAWSFNAGIDGRGLFIEWTNNSVIRTGVPIVILLYYGHGTRQGGYVKGHDFITPAIQPVFDQIADAVWREVTR